MGSQPELAEPKRVRRRITDRNPGVRRLRWNPLDLAHQREHEDNQQHEPQTSRRPVSPSLTVRPHWQPSTEQQDENNDQDEAHASESCLQRVSDATKIYAETGRALRQKQSGT